MIAVFIIMTLILSIILHVDFIMSNIYYYKSLDRIDKLKLYIESLVPSCLISVVLIYGIHMFIG